MKKVLDKNQEEILHTLKFLLVRVNTLGLITTMMQFSKLMNLNWQNIAIKLSGLYMYHRNWSKAMLDTLIDTALELFTPRG